MRFMAGGRGYARSIGSADGPGSGRRAATLISATHDDPYVRCIGYDGGPPCGKALPEDSRAKRCRACARKQKLALNRKAYLAVPCPGCGGPKSPRAKRCTRCAHHGPRPRRKMP